MALIIYKKQVKLNNIEYKFVTEYSKDISNDLITKAETELDRNMSIYKLNKILLNHGLSTAIESSIFEFTLIYILKHNYSHDLLYPVYEDKLNDIILNLDKSYLENTTLIDQLKFGFMHPENIAFHSPDELHPKQWKEIIDKLDKAALTEKNLATTDFYTCSKCKSRKSRVYEQQMRSADEPATKFITCVVCYHSFRIG